MVSARDRAIAGIGRKRGPGRPKQFDREARITVDADLDRRVRSFAAIEDLSLSEAWRTLAALALDEMERNR